MVIFWSYWKNAWKNTVDMFTMHTGVCYSSLLTGMEKRIRKKSPANRISPHRMWDLGYYYITLNYNIYINMGSIMSASTFIILVTF